MTTASFRFYAELNAFLAPAMRQRRFERACARDATIKHMVEALGVPHTEIGLVLVNDARTPLSHLIRDGDRITVYPYFPDLDAPLPVVPATPAVTRFIADAHLGLLARQLRMLGFDVLYRNSYSDREVAQLASEQQRIVLTRDRDLLMRKDVGYGCYLHATQIDAQLCEVVRRYRLLPAIALFTRCLECNALLRSVDKETVRERIPAASAQHYTRFFECAGCGHVYWQGSHVERMRQRLQSVLQHCADSGGLPDAFGKGNGAAQTAPMPG